MRTNAPFVRRLPATIRARDAGWYGVPAWIVLAGAAPSLPAALLAPAVPGPTRVLLALLGLTGLAGLVLGTLRSVAWAAGALVLLGLSYLFLWLVGGRVRELLLGLSAVVALGALRVHGGDR